MVTRRKCKKITCLFVLCALVAIFYTSLRTDRTQLALNRQGRFDLEEKVTFSSSLGALEKEQFYDSTNASAIMVFSKMRSGSSLTGDILQQDPRSFYIYEPLVAFHYALLQKKYNHLLLNGQRKYVDEVGFYNHSGKIIKSYFTCEFSEIDINTLSHDFISFGIKGRDYITCLNKKSHMTEEQVLASVRSCVNILQKQCKKSKFRIVKIVRLPMAFAGSLVSSIPFLTMIYLVRDPRAVINSMIKVGPRIKKNPDKHTKDLCVKLQNDKKAFDYFFNLLQRRMIMLKYEDLAQRPLNVSAYLYKLLGMEFSDKIRAYITSITMSGRKDGCVICSDRGNSTKHVASWKLDLTEREKEIVTTTCKQYLLELNYEM